MGKKPAAKAGFFLDADGSQRECAALDPAAVAIAGQARGAQWLRYCFRKGRECTRSVLQLAEAPARHTAQDLCNNASASIAPKRSRAL
ncbi:hypothetical protein [Verminephrobacter aporrectodeae]|uniref:hypothetical protein n=1 Tax=Verminephrobacter aporrectodeae TaxID=1110389 RepID=UPI002243DBB8|nr:hypothetical protein [Verminephrobacter aporrectodeae]